MSGPDGQQLAALHTMTLIAHRKASWKKEARRPRQTFRTSGRSLGAPRESSFNSLQLSFSLHFVTSYYLTSFLTVLLQE